MRYAQKMRDEHMRNNGGQPFSARGSPSASSSSNNGYRYEGGNVYEGGRRHSAPNPPNFHEEFRQREREAREREQQKRDNKRPESTNQRQAYDSYRGYDKN